MSNSTNPIFRPAIYPAFTFRASPTYFAWVKLTAKDIHSLRTEPGFEGTHIPHHEIATPPADKHSAGQNLYFHLNHPVRFVSVTAPVVAIEDLFSKFVLLTLDDGSGCVLSVKIKRLEPALVRDHRVELPSNTVVDNVSVSTGVTGLAWEFDVRVDGVSLDVGSVVKAKGTIDEFRGVKQIDLKRIKVLRSTAEEVREWADLARWKADVLSRPWYLGKRKLRELEDLQEAEARSKAAEERMVQERQLARLLRKKERQEKRIIYEQKREARRRKEEVMFNHGALL